jgi:glycosyltransferase involved in cell wall biosynthesis
MRFHIARSTGALRFRAVRLDTNSGPAHARNVVAAHSSAPIQAFTDDDCVPSPTWLAALVAAMAPATDIVQGRTRPGPPGARRRGVWDHTVVVDQATPFFETCNIAYRRTAFDAVGGFDVEDLMGHIRPPFGEDSVLGARVVQRGGTVVFAPDALVYHRYIPATFHDWLRKRGPVGNFAALAKRSAPVDRAMWNRIFLNQKTAAFDLAVVSACAAFGTRRPALAVGVLPWLRIRWPAAGALGGQPRIVRLGQLTLGDALELVALLRGSVRYRRLLL